MLSVDQQEAKDKILSFFNSTNDMFVLTGIPGSGKTYLLNEIVRSSPIPIALTATTNKAVGVLSEVGSATTTFKYLDLYVYKNYATGTSSLKKIKRKNKQVVYKNEVVIIDEASMIDIELYTHIREHAVNEGIKVLFVGDKNQLPPVKSSSFSVFNLGLDTAELTTCHRQCGDNSIIDVSSRLRDMIANGNYDFFPLEESNNIHLLNQEEMMSKLTEEYLSDDYKANHNHVRCLAYTNKTVQQFNKHLRDVFLTERLLLSKPVDMEFPAVGEPVVTSESFFTSGVTIPTETVCDVMRKESKHDKQYDLNYIELTLHHGNGIVVAHYCPDASALNKVKKTLKQDYKDGVIKYGDLVEFNERWIDIRNVYATTVHKSQGSTFENVFIELEDIKKCRNVDTLLRMFYVAITRARNNVYVFGNF